MATVIAWSALESAITEAEQKEGGYGRRVVAAWSHDSLSPDLATGIYGNYPVFDGEAAYQLSDGETVTL